jgi:hypothetical protein
MKLTLNLLKYVQLDQAGYGNRNNLLVRLALPSP